MSAIEDIARRAVASEAASLFERARADVPRDVRVERTGDGIIVSGRNLFARSLNDARLRGIGR